MRILLTAAVLAWAASAWPQDNIQKIEVERERGRGHSPVPPLPPTPLNPSATFGAGNTNFLILFSLGGTNGSNPYASLIEGSDGRLYGTALSGGLTNEALPEGMGTVFSLNKDGTGYRVLHHFKQDGHDGQSPYGELVEGRYGALYGTTRTGGKEGKGTIFKVNKNGRAYYVVRSFKGGPNDGAYPQAGLLRTVSDKNRSTPSRGYALSRGRAAIRTPIRVLYGTTTAGGAGDAGTVFSLNENGAGYWTTSLLSDGSAEAPRAPSSSLTEVGGILYGSSLSCELDDVQGTLFRFAKDRKSLETCFFPFFSGSVVTLYYFWFSPEPPPMLNLSSPSGPLLDGSDGWLYGTAAQGGSGNGGALFRISRDRFWDFAVLRSFGNSDAAGVFPTGGLVEGHDGSLYGTTYSDFYDAMPIPTQTNRFFGSVFRMNKDGSEFTTLKKFTGADGAAPQSKLLLGSDGVLYGTTSAGGNLGYGTIFAVLPDR